MNKNKIWWWNLTIDEKIRRSRFIRYILVPVAIILAFIKMDFLFSLLVTSVILFISIVNYRYLFKQKNEKN